MKIISDPDGRFCVWNADCLTVLRRLGDNVVDAVVTDPPYELGFMGKKWDASGIAYNIELWGEVLRVLKPGGHLLAFGGTRTYHRMACAIEDAGFEIRDSIHWVYGSGFPKSLDVSKAIDKRGGAVAGFEKFRDAVKDAMKRDKVSRSTLQDALGNFMLSHYLTAGSQPAVPNWRDYQIIRDTVGLGDEYDELFRPEAKREVVGTADSTVLAVAPGEGRDRPPVTLDITAPATDAARTWEGWGTALKPAHEPIVLARKPLIGTVAANVLEHGTGALNIDGARVPGADTTTRHNSSSSSYMTGKIGETQPTQEPYETGSSLGRWPANVVHDGSDEVVARFPNVNAGKARSGHPGGSTFGGSPMGDNVVGTWYGDSGSAARFFTAAPFDDTDAASFLYCAKPGKKERNAGVPQGTVGHPTVKPLALMRWLVRLVTPPNGIVLDPFTGSGTTLVAALLEGKQAWGCEMTDDYLDIIEGRIGWAIEQIETTIEGTR